jgi:hypothetical protein
MDIDIDPYVANPFLLLESLGTPYSDYAYQIKDTFNFKYYMKSIYEAKSLNWDLNKDYTTACEIRIIYASLLELFIEDDIVDSFHSIFNKYLKGVLSKNPHILYRDGDMNSIFHYDAVQGAGRMDAYKTIEDLYNSETRREIGIDSDLLNISILEDSNLHGISVKNIISRNS